MYQVDLNSDLGESFGRYTIGMDEKNHSPLFPLQILPADIMHPILS